MRKLASIQKVWKIEPIEGADRIELAHVLGWQCVVKKGEFKEGDNGVYFEIDSFLPIRPEYEFLRASSYKNTELMGEGFKLRTQKFRGQISQGMILPLDLVANDACRGLPVGTDVTELLGVRKYEMPEMAMTGGTAVGELPGNVPHTDETRIQAMPALLQEFAGLEYYISTKVDGSSHSISVDENGVRFMGHNYEYRLDDKCSFYQHMVKVNPTLLNDLVSYKEQLGCRSIVIQGEYAGPGIQKNRMKLMKPEWFVFDIRIDGKRVPLEDMLDIAKFFHLTTVPIEERGIDLPEKYPTIEALLKRADGNYACGSRKEGIVIRPTVPVYSKLIGTDLSMKIVSNKYLLKTE